MKRSAPPRRHNQMLSRLGMRLNFASLQKVWPGGRVWFPWEQSWGSCWSEGVWCSAGAKRGVASSPTMMLKGPSPGAMICGEGLLSCRSHEMFPLAGERRRKWPSPPLSFSPCLHSNTTMWRWTILQLLPEDRERKSDWVVAGQKHAESCKKFL